MILEKFILNMGFYKIQTINQYNNGNKITTTQYVNDPYWIKSDGLFVKKMSDFLEKFDLYQEI